MRFLPILPLLLCLTLTAPAQSVQLHKVAGPHVDSLPSAGTYVRAAKQSDTLWIWMEHVGRDGRPNYRAANEADAVVWCYPQRHPHPNHLLPNAEGQVVAITFRESILFAEVGSPAWRAIPSNLK